MAIEQKEAEVKLEERKWSTFLQKPQGPRPAPKKEQDQAPKVTTLSPRKHVKSTYFSVPNCQNV